MVPGAQRHLSGVGVRNEGNSKPKMLMFIARMVVKKQSTEMHV